MKFLFHVLVLFILYENSFYVLSLPTNLDTINPEHMGGHYQGDMIIPDGASRGAAHRPSWQRWPSGIIPYEIRSSISENNSLLIVDAMRRMENLTQVNNIPCIQFRPKTDDDEIFINIQNGSGCSAYVGYLQNFTLNRTVTLMDSPLATCMRTGIIQHELLHVLGFFHEQSRPDRDDYVSIQFGNIIAGTQNNFNKYGEDDVDTLSLPYDYGSVMHYGAYDFSSNGFATIIPVRNASAILGQRIGMSPIDILEVQRYYGCVATPETTTTTTTTPSSTTTITMTPSPTSATTTTPSSTTTQQITTATATTTPSITTTGPITTTTATTTPSPATTRPLTTTTTTHSSTTTRPITTTSTGASVFPKFAVVLLFYCIVIRVGKFIT